jgi:hypothetical protein
MMKNYVSTGVVIFLIGIGLCAFSFGGSQDVDETAKILGRWDMEVDAGGEFFYLSFSLEKTGEGIKGMISEASGFFSDVPLQDIRFDGQNLSFEMNIPTPPDGYENLVKSTLALKEGKLGGILSVEALGISAGATATKKDRATA